MTDENGPLQPANMVKALFQQLSRTLSRSRITKILAKRRITCSYPAGLMRGSMNLNAKYLSMWKRDDCCDYLHSERSQGEVIKSTMGQFIQKQKKKARGRRTKMKDFASPNSSLQPKVATTRALVQDQDTLHHKVVQLLTRYNRQLPSRRVNITKIIVVGVCYRVYLT